MNVLSVCSGVGASDLGLRLAVGRRHRTVLYVEREARNAAVLVARMDDKALDQAPIWDDLTTLGCGRYRGAVDMVSAGLPCQPYSVAGKGAGDADERALWPSFVRVVGEAEPAFVFLENVPGFRKHSEGIFHALEELGFVWAPPLIQDAHSFGAPHRRERLFLLAAHPQRVHLWLESGGCVRPSGAAHSTFARLYDHEAAVTHGGGREGEWGGWVLDRERETLRHDAHRCDVWCRICWTPWAAESPVLRVDDGAPAGLDLADRLRAVGNVGAPPVAYAAAFLTLYTQLMDTLSTPGGTMRWTKD